MRPISIKCAFCDNVHDVFNTGRLKALSGIKNDPLEEEAVTDFNVKAKYAEFNAKYFHNELPKDLPVEFAKLKNVGGMFRYVVKNNQIVPGTPKIVISNLYSRSEESLDGVLLHEMIHVLMATKGMFEEQHGAHFKAAMAQVSRISGKKIPLTDESGLELAQSVSIKPLAVLIYKTGAGGFEFGITTQKALTPEVVEAIKARWDSRSVECWVYLVQDKDWSAAAMKYPVSRNIAKQEKFFVKNSNNAFLFNELVRDGKLVYSNKNTALVIEPQK